ncbi:GNAT family N-acetyltransferase [Actinotalea sp. M2MS4P-6]|uniref:GNAT family N-acetyltransferase n=1 Tax=Actinotalea sp. M2MS4P-6 TaxID=2983762 RepID=UPI0021E37470|nr:GNAT family N-acetyltransferase [Actinotalea sp. M2MS4P-6]MCV2394050.1 GNAT family N-acetyltransferase [Actinotalea sp. M2MS4P-6]
MIEVRAARPEDVAAAGEVCVAAYVTDGHVPAGHWYTAELGDAATRAAEADLLVAVEDGTVVGTLTRAPAGTPWAEVAEPGEHELRMLAVAPVARGRGVGEALVRSALDRARGDGAARVVLTTVEFMGTAQRLYARLGLRRAPDRDWRVETGAALVYVADLVDRPGPRLEVATWPPLSTRMIGPWQLGISAGFTRRGNSAVLLDSQDGALASLDDVEAAYRAAGQRPILRLATDRSPAPAAGPLRAELDARGYRTVSTTRVLARPVRGAGEAGAAASGVDVAPAPDDAWLAGWLGTKTRTSGDVATEVARRLLTGVPARYLTARDRDGVIGVVRAARAGDWVALSCLAVDERARRRGLGRALTLAALGAPDEDGRPAQRAFLQVEIANTAASSLYRSLGFVEVDEYTYAEL